MNLAVSIVIIVVGTYAVIVCRSRFEIRTYFARAAVSTEADTRSIAG